MIDLLNTNGGETEIPLYDLTFRFRVNSILNYRPNLLGSKDFINVKNSFYLFCGFKVFQELNFPNNYRYLD